MRPEETDIVRQLDLFSQVREETFSQLMRASFLQRFPAKVELIRQNEYADFLYVLIEGQVEMYASSGTRETTIEVLDPVALFIVAAVLHDETCLQSARTLTSCRMLMIPAQEMKTAMEGDIHFMHAVILDMSRRYRRAIKELKNQKMRTSVERLANWLLQVNSIQKHGSYIDLPYEKRLLASRLGMTPENLSRGFATLSEHGIKVDGGRIVFVDMAKLEAFAQADPSIDGLERT